jgi:hypothetical protein
MIGYNIGKSPQSIVIARRLFQPTKQSFKQGSLAGKIASSYLLAMTIIIKLSSWSVRHRPIENFISLKTSEVSLAHYLRKLRKSNQQLLMNHHAKVAFFNCQYFIKRFGCQTHLF